MLAILANTITADLGLVPGFSIFGPLCGLPLSVMAAIIERPFLTAGGLRRHTVWYSIQANFLSLIVGYALVILVPFGGEVLYVFIAVSLSTVIERAYLNRRAHMDRPLRVGWVIAANVVSGGICLLLLIPVHALDHNDIKNALRPYQLPFSILLGAGCSWAVVAAFIVPNWERKKRQQAVSVDGSTPS